MRCELDNHLHVKHTVSEVEAQLFNGGIEGSYPTLLEFDYKAEVKIDTWEGISGYHDFELHENGDITAWRDIFPPLPQAAAGRHCALATITATQACSLSWEICHL
jgi:hypothetical protein